MKSLKTTVIFNGIVRVQKQLEKCFQDAGINLKLATVLDDPNLPVFRSNISDVSGTSLDIEFVSGENQHRLVVHVLNRPMFMLTFEDEVTTGSIPIERLNSTDFLKGLAVLYNKKYTDDWRIEVLKFENAHCR